MENLVHYVVVYLVIALSIAALVSAGVAFSLFGQAFKHFHQRFFAC